MFCNSIGVPSAFSLRMLVASLRGMESGILVGQKIVYTTSGAALSFFVHLPLFNMTMMMLPMYLLAIAGWNGTLTNNLRAFFIVVLDDGIRGWNCGCNGEYVVPETVFGPSIYRL